MPLSQYAEQALVNHSLRFATWTALPACYLALCTVLPTSTNTGTSITEASYTGYARMSLAGNITAATAATPSVGVNTAQITFPYTSGTSTIIAVAICDAATLGNMIWFTGVASTVISVSQNPPTVAAGALTVSVT